ncbi:MAG: hypothetical protein ACQETD_04790 [Pseudomonadota bacterium]
MAHKNNVKIYRWGGMPSPEEITEKIYQLWDQLADYDAAQPDAALDHLLGGLCELVEATITRKPI